MSKNGTTLKSIASVVQKHETQINKLQDQQEVTNQMFQSMRDGINTISQGHSAIQQSHLAIIDLIRERDNVMQNVQDRVERLEANQERLQERLNPVVDEIVVTGLCGICREEEFRVSFRHFTNGKGPRFACSLCDKDYAASGYRVHVRTRCYSMKACSACRNFDITYAGRSN